MLYPYLCPLIFVSMYLGLPFVKNLVVMLLLLSLTLTLCLSRLALTLLPLFLVSLVLLLFCFILSLSLVLALTVVELLLLLVPVLDVLVLMSVTVLGVLVVSVPAGVVLLVVSVPVFVLPLLLEVGTMINGQVLVSVKMLPEVLLAKIWVPSRVRVALMTLMPYKSLSVKVPPVACTSFPQTPVTSTPLPPLFRAVTFVKVTLSVALMVRPLPMPLLLNVLFSTVTSAPFKEAPNRLLLLTFVPVT